jgi:hypothetical protein
MTKAQMQTKLSLLPLQTPVTADDGTNENDEPVIELSYAVIPGPGEVFIQVPLNASETNLRDIVANLPLLETDRLASLAIMLVAPLPP